MSWRTAEDVNEKAHDLIKKYLTEHQRIIFNGDGYSDAWVAEAERRGLPNIRSMVDAIPALTTDKAIAMFEKFGVFTKAELESREEIQYEIYAKEINIEARAMINITNKTLIPAVIKDITCSGRVHQCGESCLRLRRQCTDRAAAGSHPDCYLMRRWRWQNWKR